MNVVIPSTIDLASSNVATSSESEFNISTTYAATNIVKVSFESDGTTPKTPVYEYQSVTSSNTGNYPPDDAVNWIRIGASNKWSMFDDYVSSQTSNTGTIDITLNASKQNKLALFALEAQTVQVIVKDSGSNTISDVTHDLKDSDSGSWSEYFFEETEYQTDLIIDLPLYYLNMTVQVVIDNDTEVAKCGHCVIGLSKELALTEYGVTAGITDYSRKETNDFGETTLIQRAYAKTLDVDLWVEHDTNGAEYDRIHRLLSGLRATPCVWNANNETSDRDTFILFGYYRDFSMVAEYATKSACSLELEGLI